MCRRTQSRGLQTFYINGGQRSFFFFFQRGKLKCETAHLQTDCLLYCLTTWATEAFSAGLSARDFCAEGHSPDSPPDSPGPCSQGKEHLLGVLPKSVQSQRISAIQSLLPVFLLLVWLSLEFMSEKNILGLLKMGRTGKGNGKSLGVRRRRGW